MAHRVRIDCVVLYCSSPIQFSISGTEHKSISLQSDCSSVVCNFYFWVEIISVLLFQKNRILNIKVTVFLQTIAWFVEMNRFMNFSWTNFVSYLSLGARPQKLVKSYSTWVFLMVNFTCAPPNFQSPLQSEYKVHYIWKPKLKWIFP